MGLRVRTKNSVTCIFQSNLLPVDGSDILFVLPAPTAIAEPIATTDVGHGVRVLGAAVHMYR
jgi:hypothetical protein